MSYFLGVIVFLWALFVLAYKAADRPEDDFGAAIPALILAVVAIVCSVIYLGLAFWLHRFL